MDTLRLMVKSILVIIMLASFLEILLPRSDMKRYINLIIGLFVIIAILNPFLTLIHKEIDLDVFDNVTSQASDTNSLINKGKELANSERKKAASQYKEKLSKQILGIAGLYQGVKTTGIDIEIVEDPAAKNFGEIRKVVIHTGSKNGESIPKDSREGVEVNVNEVNIELQQTQKGKTGNSDETQSLSKIIADFYGLTPDQVKIDK